MALRQSDFLGPRAVRRRQPPKKGRWRNLLLGLALAVALAVLGAALYTGTMVSVAVTHVSEGLSPEVAPEVRPLPVQMGQRINILLLGLDEDRLRSDVMMLISVDPETRKVGVLQIPRDTRAYLAGKGTTEKINGAYAYGVGDKQFPGNLRALKSVESLLDVTIHYTVVIDLNGFRHIIDEIGGVWVDIPRKMDYDDPAQNLHIHFQPGRQKLDGKRALEFVRWRHNNDGTGYPDQDLGRIRTQQQFLQNVMDELLKPANLPRLPAQLVALSRYISSTMEPAQVLSLAKVAATLSKNDVEFRTLPGTDAYLYDPQAKMQLSFFIADPVATRPLADRLIRGIDPQAAAGARVALVSAGNDEKANQLADRLREEGFAVTVSPSQGQPPAETQIIDLTGGGEKGKLVGRALVSRGMQVQVVQQPSTEAEFDVRVILSHE